MLKKLLIAPLFCSFFASSVYADCHSYYQSQVNRTENDVRMGASMGGFNFRSLRINAYNASVGTFKAFKNKRKSGKMMEVIWSARKNTLSNKHFVKLHEMVNESRGNHGMSSMNQSDFKDKVLELDRLEDLCRNPDSGVKGPLGLDKAVDLFLR